MEPCLASAASPIVRRGYAMACPPRPGGSMKARWYFDFVSPFSYLHVNMFDRIAIPLEIEPVPVLFAGLLKAAGSKGPAEIPAKRTQTYRYCTWLARTEGIPFRFPPRHPFNPLFALRLAIARGVTLE